MSSESHIVMADKAFSTQAPVFDKINNQSPVISWMRKQVYHHILNLNLPSGSRVLELNAGTGIDACQMAQQGFQVLATDVSAEMLEQASQRVSSLGMQDRVNLQQCSYTRLDDLNQRGFDLIFSNFGGLNCIEDFKMVGRHFTHLLNPGGVVCLVMISPFCFWETLTALKGNFGLAFRRFKKSVPSKVEGINMVTTYFSPVEIEKILGGSFSRMSLKSLATFTPPPYLDKRFRKYPKFLRFLNGLDEKTAGWPVLRSMGDHYILTLKYQPQ